jgi:hypothetical protein
MHRLDRFLPFLISTFTACSRYRRFEENLFRSLSHSSFSATSEGRTSMRKQKENDSLIFCRRGCLAAMVGFDRDAFFVTH